VETVDEHGSPHAATGSVLPAQAHTCAATGCGRNTRRRGLCGAHYGAWRTRQHAYGCFVSDYVDPAPARTHVRALQAAGLGERRIAELARLHRTHITSVNHGRSRTKPDQPATKISTRVAAAILAVPIPGNPVAVHHPGRSDEHGRHPVRGDEPVVQDHPPGRRQRGQLVGDTLFVAGLGAQRAQRRVVAVPGGQPGSPGQRDTAGERHHRGDHDLEHRGGRDEEDQASSDHGGGHTDDHGPDQGGAQRHSAGAGPLLLDAPCHRSGRVGRWRLAAVGGHVELQGRLRHHRLGCVLREHGFLFTGHDYLDPFGW